MSETLTLVAPRTAPEAAPRSPLAPVSPPRGVPGPHAAAPRRVLIVSYLFPPVGGAGVQRAVKFVKYLSEFGWQPSVLTVANPSVPVMDRSLLADIPRDVTIHKARTLEPGYAVKSIVSAGAAGADTG